MQRCMVEAMKLAPFQVLVPCFILFSLWSDLYVLQGWAELLYLMLLSSVNVSASHYNQDLSIYLYHIIQDVLWNGMLDKRWGLL